MSYMEWQKNLASFPTCFAPPSKKQSYEWIQIPWAYSTKVVRINEIAKLAIIMQHFPHNSKIYYLYLTICTFFEWV